VSSIQHFYTYCYFICSNISIIGPLSYIILPPCLNILCFFIEKIILNILCFGTELISLFSIYLTHFYFAEIYQTTILVVKYQKNCSRLLNTSMAILQCSRPWNMLTTLNLFSISAMFYFFSAIQATTWTVADNQLHVKNAQLRQVSH